MRTHIIFLHLLFTTASGLSQQAVSKWNERLEKQHLDNRQIPATWDNKLLQRDIGDSLENSKGRPFPHGAFPVPKYDLAGKFRYRGAGAGGNVRSYFDKKLVYSFFFAGKTATSETYLKEKEDEVFFMLVMLTDFVDTVRYTHGSAYILSRNNPDVVCEGFFRTIKDEVAYTAFLTAGRDEFAIVNMRLFNLKAGRIILIAPQKDRSLRSLQLMAPILSSKEISVYLDKTLEQDSVKTFFTSNGNL